MPSPREYPFVVVGNGLMRAIKTWMAPDLAAGREAERGFGSIAGARAKLQRAKEAGMRGEDDEFFCYLFDADIVGVFVVQHGDTGR
jgi:hypothetical protein